MLLSIKEASRALGVPRRILRQMAKGGQIPYYKDGSPRILIDILSARAVLDRQR
jgi:excisionase family DNA binding protein